MRIVFHTMIWQRHEIFKFWAKNILSLIAAFPKVEILAVVAGSEGRKSKKLVESYGFHYVEAPNMPLGKKANFGLLRCKDLKPDYVLFLGSDDLVSIKTFRYLLKRMKEGYDEICNMDLYLYDIASCTTIYSCGYTNKRKGEPMGVGRCLSRKILNKIKWDLWENIRNKGLDGSSWRGLEKIKHSRYTYWLKKEKLMIVDIKSQQRITSFKIRSNNIEIDFKEITNQLPGLYKLLIL